MASSVQETEKDAANCSASTFFKTLGAGHVVETARSEVREAPVIVAKPETETKRPPFYKVIMLNDDYTPMDFVVQMLKEVFHHPHAKAVDTMLQIHNQGAGVCGVFTRDVAETKIVIVSNCARQNEYPLQMLMEKT